LPGGKTQIIIVVLALAGVSLSADLHRVSGSYRDALTETRVADSGAATSERRS